MWSMHMEYPCADPAWVSYCNLKLPAYTHCTPHCTEPVSILMAPRLPKPTWFPAATPPLCAGFGERKGETPSLALLITFRRGVWILVRCPRRLLGRPGILAV